MISAKEARSVAKKAKNNLVVGQLAFLRGVVETKIREAAADGRDYVEVNAPGMYNEKTNRYEQLRAEVGVRLVKELKQAGFKVRAEYGYVFVSPLFPGKKNELCRLVIRW